MTRYHFFKLPRGNNPGGPIHHTIAHTITTFAGRNGFIDPRDGLPNTTPHIIHTFQ